MNLTENDILWNRYSIFQYLTLTDVIIGLYGTDNRYDVEFGYGVLIITRQILGDACLVGKIKYEGVGGYIIYLYKNYDGYKKLGKKLVKNGFQVRLIKISEKELNRISKSR